MPGSGTCNEDANAIDIAKRLMEVLLGDSGWVVALVVAVGAPAASDDGAGQPETTRQDHARQG